MLKIFYYRINHKAKYIGHLAGLQCIAKLNDTGNIKVVYVAITLHMQKNFCTVIKTSIKFLAKYFCSLATVPDKILFVLNYFRI